jgi:hypothetical protein
MHAVAVELVPDALDVAHLGEVPLAREERVGRFHLIILLAPRIPAAPADGMPASVRVMGRTFRSHRRSYPELSGAFRLAFAAPPGFAAPERAAQGVARWAGISLDQALSGGETAARFA